jgi:predicted  nucleic acid-binding Zn-ribbon protein
MAKNTVKASNPKMIAKPDNAPKVKGRKPNAPRTVEQEIERLNAKYYKLNARINALEDKLADIGNNTAEPVTAQTATPDYFATVHDSIIANQNDIVAAIQAIDVTEQVTEIREMLNQLLDSMGEAE